jgi:hypothetical protein
VTAANEGVPIISQLTTFEQAKLCPICGRAGADRATIPAQGLPRGTTVHTIYCVTELCEWYNTPWMVQVNPDGSVPPPQDHTRSEKHYVGFEGHDEHAENIRLGLIAQQELETKGGGEVRNPNTR